MHSLAESLQNIAAFNFLLFGMILISTKNKGHVSNLWFAMFLIGKGITLLSNLILFSGKFVDNYMILSLGLILNSFLLFYAPLLFIYSVSLTKRKVGLSSYWIHFIPFILFLLINISTVLHLNGFDNSIGQSYLSLKIDWLGYFYYFQAIVYTLISILQLVNAKKKSKEYLSNLQKFQFNWFIKVLLLFFIVWLSFLSANIFPYYSDYQNIGVVLSLLGTILLLLLANYTAFTIFNKPEVLMDFQIEKTSSKKTISLAETHFLNLKNLMDDQKLFKNPDLSLQLLSEELNLSARNTSQLIKEKTDKNFYDFINSYRIAEAKKILSQDQNKPTILEVLYEVGFNSKSVFNSTFKKQENLTPTQYRNLHLKTA
jgi:AraC-like DNA-binding protein